jgi:hypothetical protein
MKIIPTTITFINLINCGFKYVIETSKLYNIDESHALKHSMEVYQFAKKIYNSEVVQNSYLDKHKEIIYMAAIGHDMCDKKYMNEIEGIFRYQEYLKSYMSLSDLDILGKIIGTMSYSKVKKHGYPELGEYQLAYHIVREADLLAAYDIERCIIYKMYKDNFPYNEALEEATELFNNRVFKMREDGLFLTNYSQKESLILHKKAEKNVKSLREILHISEGEKNDEG